MSVTPNQWGVSNVRLEPWLITVIVIVVAVTRQASAVADVIALGTAVLAYQKQRRSTQPL